MLMYTLKKAYGNPPCRDCSERKVGCHSTCENYISYDKAHKEEKARINRARYLDSITIPPKLRARARSKIQET